MSQSEPIGSLMEDHEVILRALNVFEIVLDKLERNEKVELNAINQLLDFFTIFVDGCHHVKEETALFPRLNERGIPGWGGPIGVMVIEHEEVRKYTRAMYNALEGIRNGNAEAKNSLIENGRNYINLLTQHISKENDILFPMGRNVLTEQDNMELAEAFERIDKEKGEHEKFIKLIESLEKEMDES